MMGMKKTLIYGAGGLGREILDLLREINSLTPKYDIEGFIDDGISVGSMASGLPILGGISYIKESVREMSIVFGIVDCDIKARLFSEINGLNRGFDFPSVVYPRSYVSPRAEIGEGTVVGRFCSVNIDAYLGRCVFLNTRCDIGHDSRIGDFCSIMPNVNISGSVTIGERTMVGVQSAVIQGVKVGSRVTVGMGSRVMSDVPDDCTVMGYPARIIARHNNTGDRDC